MALLPVLLFAAASSIAQLQIEAFRQKTIELAPRGAFDCGSPVAPGNMERCATERLARKAPFFSVYAPPQPRDLGYDIRRSMIAYIGDRTGTLFELTWNRSQKYVRSAILGPSVNPPPVRVGGWVRPPEVVRQMRIAVEPGSIQGLAIFEALIGRDGTVRDVRQLKPFGQRRGKPDAVAERLLRKVELRPGTFFGQPLPVIFNFSAKIENGEMTVPVIYPRGTDGLIPWRRHMISSVVAISARRTPGDNLRDKKRHSLSDSAIQLLGQDCRHVTL